jgi:hypothetical protein
MRDKITIKFADQEWKMIIPGFGFNGATEKTFSRWPDAISYMNRMPLGSSGAYERARHDSDGIGERSPWSPLQEW